jgi:hypothetical protein
VIAARKKEKSAGPHLQLEAHWKRECSCSSLFVFCFPFFFSSWKPRCNFYCQLHGCMLCKAIFIQQIGSAWISTAGTATTRHRILNFIAAALKQTKNKPQHATVFFLFAAS